MRRKICLSAPIHHGVASCRVLNLFTLMMEPNADIVAVFGPPPDGIDIAESSVVQNNAAVIVLAVLASAAVALRILSRFVQGHDLKADDWAIVGSLVCSYKTRWLRMLD